MRPQHADMTREAISQMQLARVVVGDGDDKVKLDIWPRQRGIGLQKRAAFGEGRGDHACPVPSPLRDMLDQGGGPDDPNAEHVGVSGFVGQYEIDMVAEVLTDARQFMDHFDAVALQILRAPDPGELKKLGRVERAGAQDHLAPRLDQSFAAMRAQTDACRAPAIEFDLGGMRPGDNRKILATLMGMQISSGGRATFSDPRALVKLRHLIEPGAFLLGAVEIVIDRYLQFACGRDEGARERAGTSLIRDLEGP